MATKALLGRDPASEGKGAVDDLEGKVLVHDVSAKVIHRLLEIFILVKSP